MDIRVEYLINHEAEVARRFEDIQRDLNYLISIIPTGMAREQLTSANVFVQGAKVHTSSLIVIAKNTKTE